MFGCVLSFDSDVLHAYVIFFVFCLEFCCRCFYFLLGVTARCVDMQRVLMSNRNRTAESWLMTETLYKPEPHAQKK